MKILSPEINHHNGNVMYKVNVHSSLGSKTLWYKLNEKYSSFISESSDAPLVALLIPAMVHGEDIYLDGTVSEKLYYNLSGPYQHVLQLIIPSLHLVKIYPATIKPSIKEKEYGVATGFSGGIDSFCVIADHYYSNDVPEGFRLTHLLFNNVGSHGSGEEGRTLFRKRYERLKPIAENIGLPFIDVDTNMDSFYNGLRFQQTHTLQNASVGLLLQQGLKSYLYASTYNYADVFIGPTYDMAYSDVITLPLLSTETLDIFSVGSEYTRVEKTLVVTGIADSYEGLDVCLGNDENCSICSKCLRTLLTLEIAGKLECYKNVFDLDAYMKIRKFFISEILKSNDPFLREIKCFAKEMNFKIPAFSKLYSEICYPVRVFKNKARMLRKRLLN